MLQLYKSNSSCPPEGYLLEVARHCPRALETYIYLWKNKNAQDTVYIDKEEIRSKYMKTRTKFRNDLEMLSIEGVISVVDDDKRFEIELLNWDDELAQTYA